MSTELEKSEKEVENKSEKAEKISSKSEKNSTKASTSWWKDTRQYLHEVKVEVQTRVSWPTYESVKASTKVVIISSILLGLFIGVCDLIFNYGFTAIINSTSNTGLG
jgi:preprotein translocase SecE subunit